MSFDPARRELIDTCVQLADRGYLAGTGGNVACRTDDEHFAITPSASDYYSLGLDDICVLRLNDLVQVAGDRRPSVEYRLHANVLRARKDCGASIHTHQPIASACSLLGRDLSIEQLAHQAILGPKVVCAGYAPSGTRWLASRLRKRLRPEVNAYLLRNHGAVCCGTSLGDAVTKVETLEIACSDFFRKAIIARADRGVEAWVSEALLLLVRSEERESES